MTFTDSLFEVSSVQMASWNSGAYRFSSILQHTHSGLIEFTFKLERRITNESSLRFKLFLLAMALTQMETFVEISCFGGTPEKKIPENSLIFSWISEDMSAMSKTLLRICLDTKVCDHKSRNYSSILQTIGSQYVPGVLPTLHFFHVLFIWHPFQEFLLMIRGHAKCAVLGGTPGT